MKGKSHIACLLLVIGLLMPIIPVIPHHHHADGRICMKHDIATDCCDGHHHHGKADPCCGGDCVAIHFFEQTPNSDEQGAYTFTPEEITLFFEPSISLLTSPKETVIDTPPYRERLHGTPLMRAEGLRAPPALLA